MSSAFRKEQCDANCLVPASRSKLLNIEFQLSVEILSSLSIFFFFSISSAFFVSSISLSSLGGVSSLEEFPVVFFKLFLFFPFSTFFLLSLTSPGRNETILSKAISKPLDRLGAINKSRLAIRPIW